jgi:hypothetical protein
MIKMIGIEIAEVNTVFKLAKKDQMEKVKRMDVIMTATMTPMFAAIGFSLIYLLFGGGLGGAVLIFIIAKMLGK